MTTIEFLAWLWGEQPPGFIQLWSLAEKRSTYLATPQGYGLNHPTDVYTGVGLAHQSHGPHRRTPNDLVCAVAGLWADIDVDGGPDHKKGACPTWDDAYDTAQLLSQPTIIVHSGYGLQAWWLFEEGAWRFKTRAEQVQAARAVAQWQKLLRERSGFGLDFTHDLARLLRLPGTYNGKGGEKHPVEVIERGPRHARDELIAIASEAGYQAQGYALGRVPPAVEIEAPLHDADGHGLAIVQRLVNRSPRFRQTINHERSDLPSMSEKDLALASMAALAGCTDQEIADVIAWHRRAYGDHQKARRLDYLKRTIAKARRQHDETPAAPKDAKPGTFVPAQWADSVRDSFDVDTTDLIPLPFPQFNTALGGGISPGDFVLVGGYTSHGKSVFVDMCADTAAAAGKRCHLYLTEMTAVQRGLRLLARRANVDFERLRRHDLSDEDWTQIDAELVKFPYGCSIVVDWSVDDVAAHIRENKWDLAVIDLIHGFGYADERDLSKTSSAIVRAAKAANTAVVAAAHLNDTQMREARSPKRPKPGMHSLKGSTSLKQDADVVMFVWLEDNEEGLPTDTGEMWIAKARQGGFATVPVRLVHSRMTFVEFGGLEAA